MGSFSSVIIMPVRDKREFDKIKKIFGSKDISLAVKWSYNGELIPVEDFKQIGKMNRNSSYAEKILLESNQRL